MMGTYANITVQRQLLAWQLKKIQELAKPPNYSQPAIVKCATCPWANIKLLNTKTDSYTDHNTIAWT